MKIRINEIKDIKEFYSYLLGKVNGTIYATQNNHKVNAKSLMGMFSLDLSQPIEITSDNEEKDLYEYIKKWECQ